ncbi:MAG TPA: MerR family transcriptional regulator [Terriglobia bacterium]|nr:MerR family transcriptional regulator [Terriglobia bacterium]
MNRKTSRPAEKPMKIGQVAKLSGVGVETIRFYERQGILPKPRRRASGYREFDLDTVERIRFIQKVQDLGFTLNEAGDLASAKGIPAAIERITDRIQELRKLQRELSSLHKHKF